MPVQNFAIPQHLPPEQAVEQQLGVSYAALRETAMQCYRQVKSTSELQPKGSGGTLAWIFGTETLRGQLIPLGWTPADVNNQPRVVSPDGKIAITVMCGDAHTGNLNRMPSTRNTRGSQTVRSVNINARQLDMFADHLSNIASIAPKSSEEQTLWILLYYIDLVNDEVHYELSRPVNMGENEKVDDWKPRFTMPPLLLGAPDDYQGPPPASPDIDIPVTPRS
jgi:hypothetical protein